MGIRAVDAGRLVRSALTTLPRSDRPVWIIAAGKAAMPMAAAAVEVLGSRVQGGVVVSPGGVPPLPLDAVVGEHPQPGPGSEEGGRRALAVAEAIPADAELITLISGGASALMAVPADGISLRDKREATGVLLRSGADIYALNTVRKHLSRIKGGRLAAASRAVSRAFVLSDVVGDDLSFIASGPTVADPATYGEALFVIDRFGGRHAFPEAVVEHLCAGVRGERPESPKPGDPRLAKAETVLVGGRMNAMRGAEGAARQRGYDVRVVDAAVVGEARLAGAAFARSALALARTMRRPSCVIASGETTVRVRGSGLGGRNQELTAAAAEALAGCGDRWAIASAGTDGIDGPTDAAGALADASTLDRAAADGLPPVQAVLDDNNAYAYFDALGDLIRTGPTGTNVGDLQVFLLA